MSAVAQRQKWQSKGSWSGSIERVVGWSLLIGWAVFSLVPIVWLLLAATKSSDELASMSPYAFGSFSTLSESWGDLMAYDNGIMSQWVVNTVILTVAGIALTVIATVPAGYALGTMAFKGRKTILMSSLLLMLMPGAALVLPLYMEMTMLGLVRNRLSVILPMAVFPMGVYLAFIYFSTAVNRDIYDAARIDGCSEWKVFLKIGLPLAKPITALVTFFAFLRNWNDFFLPYIMLSSEKQPLPVGLATLASVAPELKPNTPAMSEVGIPEIVLCTLVTMIPILIVVLIAQRTILKGADLLGGGLRE